MVDMTQKDTTRGEAVAGRKRRPGFVGIAAIAAGVLAIAGWTAFGVTTVALNESTTAAAQAHDDLEHSERDLIGVKLQLRQAENDRDTYEAEVDAIGDREAAVEVKEAELEEREAAVKAVAVGEDGVLDRVRDAAGPEGIPHPVDLTLQLACGSLNDRVARRYSR